MLGQRYVGLTIALRTVDVEYRGVGLDVAEGGLRVGKPYGEDVADRQVRAGLSGGRFMPTSRYGGLASISP